MKAVEPFTPIQYLIGHSEFYGFEIGVDENVLIPRPETEMLVDAGIELSESILASRLAESCASFNQAKDTGCERQAGKLRIKNNEIRILDLCTGSGCIAIALAGKLPQILTKQEFSCKISACDISAGALEVARSNAVRHNLLSRIEFIQSDLFDNIAGKFDIILSNPPYIAGFEFGALQKEVLREPKLALYGGEDGLDYYRRITTGAHNFAHRGSYLVFEVGFAQAGEVCAIINSSEFFKVTQVRKDFSGIDRVVIAKWTN